MTEKNMWNLSPQEALKACQASEQGLTTEQAEKIRLEKGENVLLEEKKKSAFQVFLDQFKDLMVVILIGAAIISMFSGNEESTIVIFAVLVMNAVLGTVQHMKAEKSLESLKQLSAATMSPASNSRISPGTTSFAGISCFLPSLITLASGADSCFKLSKDFSA